MTRQKCSLAITAFASVAVTLFATPASANSGFEDAHSLRSLDIMLMVTSLRCRTSAHDFQSDYHRFSAANLKHLNSASDRLKRSFRASYGESNPARALDRMGVKIANSYGDGHPWLSCAQLKEVTQTLAQNTDAQSLVANARYLLSAERPTPATSAQTAPRIAHGQGDVQISYNLNAGW
ncbi:S-adenosyl-L-homocysteine hydrolase [Erythrobacter sp. SCSIO 43205]|uniref:S-adenosyl-L-homocysteine hydrolase n=1 Tax=Erythrobacter sp. SCSIO 43205 TaxID=2779361 RepID=UPI001CAA095A|nr:S-adenosyl-L-homocysteine hydrolase [Erythrobacter sp. SCSIO 43205]UAB76917.1 S-adenosyl-L-homocysteine hydrolase [Erythrobacter sp. SCSIO 43205]